jgi:carbon-monoxide dehydrogenase medium subunit
MANLNEYLSPTSMADAVRLLSSSESNYAALAGGTRLVGELETGQASELDGVVALAGLGLDTILVDGDTLIIGAMVSLSDIVEHDVAGGLAGGLLYRAARGEGPLNLRNAATIGGVVATAEADSEFYAALLALNATVHISDEAGESSTPLAELTGLSGLVTAVSLPLAEARSGLARVARTPSDRPIVAAVAAVNNDGETIALCGVADRPILQGKAMNPPDDFKGSADYRRVLVPIVVERAYREARG